MYIIPISKLVVHNTSLIHYFICFTFFLNVSYGLCFIYRWHEVQFPLVILPCNLSYLLKGMVKDQSVARQRRQDAEVGLNIKFMSILEVMDISDPFSKACSSQHWGSAELLIPGVLYQFWYCKVSRAYLWLVGLVKMISLLNRNSLISLT